MSDWPATHSTAQSIIAGMDLEMPTGVYYGDQLYDQIYVTRNLSESYLNRAVGHILSQYERFGLLSNNGTVNEILVTTPLNESVIEASASTAYEIAVKSGVLLKNKNSTLPLASKSSFGIFGPSGLQYTHGTGFAERAFGFVSRKISVLQGLQQKTNASIPSAVGVDLQGTIIPSSALRDLNGMPGLSRNDSTALDSFVTDAAVDFNESLALSANNTYTWQGSILAPSSGYYRISLQRLISSPSGGNNNSDFNTIFTTASLFVDNVEITKGSRLYLNGGARPWSSGIITTDGWDNIGAGLYLEAGSHNISASVVGILGQPVSARLCWSHQSSAKRISRLLWRRQKVCHMFKLSLIAKLHS